MSVLEKTNLGKNKWHSISLEDISREFTVDLKKGLNQTEVADRRSKYGHNTLPRGKRVGPVVLFFRQFANPLVLILLVAAGLTFFVNEYIDMTVILIAVFVNVAIGFWQEFRSNKIFEKLEKMVEVRAHILRDGRDMEIDMKELVPGDVIYLKGDAKIPADARLISARNLSVNEALLTGESEAQNKEEGVLSFDLSLGDRKNMVYMGTIAEGGEGRAVVVGTGRNTEIGNIAELTLNVENEKTPLQDRLSRLGKKIAIAVTVFSILIFVVGYFQGGSLVELFEVSVAVAVAAIPEGLPAALSVVLAVSATRILRKKGLVKKLVGAETLGSTSVIVCDKTGTLTTGVMKVEHLLSETNKDEASLALALASDVVFITGDNGEVKLSGESTDKAKVQFFLDNGGEIELANKEYKICSLLPFDEIKKYIASFRVSPDGSGTVFITGAPEVLLSMSDISDHEKKNLLKEVEDYAGNGYRMIGIAKKKYKSASNWDCENNISLEKNIREITYLGTAAIRDPIRKDVHQSVEITRGAGVRIIMATGDHRLTALSIGRDLGFSSESTRVMNGEDIDRLDDEEFKERLKKIDIFSRVSPSHKLRITKALKDSGEVVAMTGDGVNDAPALRQSDIGISLGSGTDITKETADLVLLDNSFSIITDAIKEGRTAFDNIRKVAVFLLSNSFTEIIVILAALILQTAFLPVTAVMILWANLVEDAFPNFALAFEPGERDIMKRKPLSENEPILDKQGIIIIFIIGILSDIMLVGIFMYLLTLGLSKEHVQTLIFALLATNSLFIVFAIKSYHASILHTKIYNNMYLIGAVLIGLVLMAFSIYSPPLQKLLGTVSLSGKEVFLVLVVIFFQVWLIELVKWWFRRSGKIGYAK